MSNEIITLNSNFPTENEMKSVALIAKTAHMSGLYKGVGGEAIIMMILLAAKELGVGPCQALNGGIWSIQGKIEISARLMNGLIRRAGHSIKIIRSNDECCTLKGTRTDGDSFEVSFTKEDAIKAGLWGMNTWKKYPGDMLYNRCMSRLGRRLFSDVIGQNYIEGEISEAKEVERMQQAECEVKNIAQPISQPQENGIDSNLIQEKVDSSLEQIISSDQLDELMIEFAKTTKDFQKNSIKYMKNEWKVSEFEHLPAIHYDRIMKGIALNLKGQAEGVIK